MQGSGTRCAGCHGPLTLGDETQLIGQTLGKYRVESVLGSGGMGVVYRAVHTALGRPAAVKVMAPQGVDDTFRDRFLREARVLAGLDHPNIVEIYDYDVSDW